MSRVKWLIMMCLLAAIRLLPGQDGPDTALWTLGLQDVVVTAQYAPTDSRSAVHDIYTIDRATIESRGANNLEQLLQQEASIRISQDLILGSSVSLLGIEGQNVKIMVDGVPVIGRQDGNIDLSQLNLHHIERVEIVEGPLSVSYGTDALGGVINLISKKSQLDKWELKGVSQVEDRGENRYAGQLGVRLTDALSLRLNGGYDLFGGYSEDTLRSVLWNPKEQWFADGYLGWRFGNGHHLYYSASFFDEEVANLGDVRRPQFKPYAFDDHYRTRRFNHSLAHEGPVLDNFYLQATAGYNHFGREKQTLRTNFEEDTQEEVAGQQDTSSFTGLMLRSTFASRFEDSPLNFQLGIDLRYDDATGQRIQDTLSSKDNFSRISDYALFGSLRYQPIAPLLLEMGLRYAHNTRYDAPLTPSVHVKYDLNGHWALRASYSKGFRSPDIKELFFNFVDINHFIMGNPGLKAERSDNLQAGLFYQHRSDKQRLNLKLKAFYNHIRDKIELFEFVETPGGIRPAVDTSTLRFAYFNQTVYKTQGAILSLGYATKALELNSNLSVIGYYNPASEEFSELDAFTYAVELSNSLTYNIPEQSLSFSLFVRNNDKQVSFFPEEGDDGQPIAAQRLQEGFTLADFTCTKKFRKGQLSLTGGVKNLLDVQQVNVSGAGGGGAHSGSSGLAPVGPGRNFFLRVEVGLGW